MNPVWTPGSWIFDKNFPIAVDGVPVAQPNFTDSPTVTWTLDPTTMQVTANFAGASPNNPTFIYTGTVDPTITTGLLTGSLYVNTSDGGVFELQIVSSVNTWVEIGSLQAPVSSVFGRNGAVVAQFGDYSFNEISGTLAGSQIPPLNQLTGSVMASQVPSLNQLTGSITSSQLPVPVVSGNINNIVTVDGVTYTTLHDALAALPAVGGTIDMRGNSSSTALALGTGFTSGVVDTGNGPSVTILLGPYSYTAAQIVLRTNLHIIGCGTGSGLSSTKPPTIIKSVGSNSTPLFVLAQVVGEGQEDVVLTGLNLEGASGNSSQTCFSLVCPLNGGLWYSEFNDIVISGFSGEGIYLASNNAGINQFTIFRRVIVFRVANGSYALEINGYANSLRFENCEFDGNPADVSGGDGLTNIYIHDAVGAPFVPYDIQFDLLTCQWAGVGMQISGCDSVEIDQGHFEGCFGAIQLSDGVVNNCMGVSVRDSWFGNQTGVHGGNGFIFNQTSGNSQLSVTNCHAFTVPDLVFKGTVTNTPQFAIFNSTSPVPLPPALGSATGFGNGSAGTAVTTTTTGTGTGPAAPETIVSYQQVQVNGSVFWIPLVQ